MKKDEVKVLKTKAPHKDVGSEQWLEPSKPAPEKANADSSIPHLPLDLRIEFLFARVGYDLETDF